MPSSVSMCIASANFSETLITTSSKMSARSSVSIFTQTFCFSSTPHSFAVSGVRCICLFAAITPSVSSTSPQGPTSLQPADPAMSPDSLIGACTPMDLASVREISTWSAFLQGPRIDTPESVRFGPTMSILSTHANCPGCDRSLIGVSW